MVDSCRADQGSGTSHDRFLAELVRVLQPLEDPENIMATACRRLGEHLAADRCAYAVGEDDQDHFTMTGSYGTGLPPLTGRFALSQFGVITVESMRAGQILTVTDAREDHRLEPGDRQIFDQSGIVSAIVVPLHKAGRLVAGMAVHHRSVRRWTAGEVDVTATVVGRCWESVQRAHALVAMRESEQRSRLLIERASDAIWLVDNELRYLDANPAACTMLGYSRLEHRAMSVRDLIDPAELPRLSTVIDQIEAGEHARQEWSLRRKDGSWVPVELSLGAAGLGRFQAIGRDITERLRIEAERERLLVREQAGRRAAEEFGVLVAQLSRATRLEHVIDAALDHGSRLGVAGVAGVTVELAHRGGLRRAGARGHVPGTRSAAPSLLSALGTGEPVWTADPVAVPLRLGSRCVGVLGLWSEGSVLVDDGVDEDRRTGLVTAAGVCAQALERVRLHEAEHEVAQVLQRSLLPRALPGLSRLAATARYRPAAVHTSSGGDWYDMLPLTGTTVALVVGDVVGHGPAAAAVMGQLRSALASLLLDGHGPAAALERLDRFAAGVDGAHGSTCACMTLDWASGELRWALAGHPPPLLVDEEGARFTVGGAGILLGVRSPVRYVEAGTTIRPGTTVVLYSDGLVERRDEVIDDGLERLAAAAARHAGHGPAELADLLLAATSDAEDPPDDIALLVVRSIPAPLAGTLPATPSSVRDVRRATTHWLAEAGVPEEQAQDLQLALGETVTNAVEHAYPPDGPGEFDYHLCRTAEGALRVRVRDHGRWRPVPADNGFRGHGLRVIRQIGADVVIDRTDNGTEVVFEVPPGPVAATGPLLPAVAASGAVAVAAETTRVRQEPGVVVLDGALDLEGLARAKPALEAAADLEGSVCFDLSGVSYLCSAAIALMASSAAQVSYRVTAGTAPARMLELTGLSGVSSVEVVPARRLDLPVER